MRTRLNLPRRESGGDRIRARPNWGWSPVNLETGRDHDYGWGETVIRTIPGRGGRGVGSRSCQTGPYRGARPGGV